jgi:hypothetical protein
LGLDISARVRLDFAMNSGASYACYTWAGSQFDI